MQDPCEPFRGKKITLLGLGLLGRGVGDAEYLVKCGAQVTVTDKKSEEELAESVKRLGDSVTFHLGGHRVEDFTSCDMVIKAAGVPLDSPEIQAARGADVPVYMSTALFAKYAMEAGAIIVGVTGTRGKTTISRMIYHALQQAGKRVHLGGNVRGISTLALLPEIQTGDIAVLELDSWQLQGFGDLKLSPHIAVFTNLMPDHLNYYGGDMEQYFTDKANIFRFQKAGDTLVAGKGLAERLKSVHPIFPAPLPATWALKVPGEHNRENSAFAAGALKALGLTKEEIKTGLESFEGVEGRLQFVREVSGVKIYNDNNATTPEATIAALNSLQGDIALIVGGSEKNLELQALVATIKSKANRLIVLTHPNYKGSERLAARLKKADVAFVEAGNLEEAIKKGMEGMQSGNLLFSPAFASFGMFKNEYERNDEFLHLVASL